MRKLLAEEMGRLDVEQFKSSPKINVTVVLDNVRSLYNVGSVFRTSDAFRIEKIILCGITATPETNMVEIHKTALGAEETVDWTYEKDCADAVSKLKADGYLAVAVEQVEGSIGLEKFEADASMKYALILGNEVKGVDQKVVDMCDMSLEIPQYGTKHSLNVSVTAGIVLWEFAKRLEASVLK